MAARDVVLVQLQALAQEIHRCRTAIASPDVDKHLADRVGARLDNELTRVENRQAELGVRAARNEPSAAWWSDFRQLRNDAAPVFDECLAFVQGAWARAHQLDEGMCALTDDLLDDLAKGSDIQWGRFTLLATSEFFRSTADIIRIRYPDLSFWSLALAAHEFGHYAGPKMRRSEDGVDVYPFQQRLAVADQNRGNARHSKEWQHLQEYFADVFATYTLGPAYAVAFITLRVNPADAYVESLTHPAHAARVHGIFRTLDRMNERATSQARAPFREVIALLRGGWRDTLIGAGQPDGLQPAAEALVTQRVSELFDMIINATPQRLQFGRDEWLRVEDAAADLAKEEDGQGARMPDGMTRRDVVNAAWLARLQAERGARLPKRISRAASELFRRIQ